MKNPILVSLKEVASAFASNESAITEAGKDTMDADGALALAAIGKTLRAIQDQPTDGPAVMETKQHGPVSRLQSLIASGEKANLKLSDCPTGGLEAKFDTHDLLGWAKVAWERIRHPVNHALLAAPATPESLPAAARVGILGDWGTGLYGAPVAAGSIANDPAAYGMLVHLGDVYYSGTNTEVLERFLDLWPSRPEAVNRYTNGNHEMYSGGYAYFDEVLPKFGQKASYFAHQNDHWTLVGLDVAYKDHAIDDAQVAWLQNIINNAGNRKVILFSHHQLFSHYETQGTKLWANAAFKSILQSGKIFAWYWGHEHRCCIFDAHAETGILARCVGHGGMPQSRKPTWGLDAAKNVGPNWADWRQASATIRDGITVPHSLVLEGTNPYIIGEEDKFLPHGYAVLNFDGPHLTEQVMEPDGKVIYEKSLA